MHDWSFIDSEMEGSMGMKENSWFWHVHYFKTGNDIDNDIEVYLDLRDTQISLLCLQQLSQIIGDRNFVWFVWFEDFSI